MIKAHKDPGLAPALILPDGPEWVDTLATIDRTQAQTACMILRTLFPHDALGDGVYRRTVAKLDRHPATAPVLGQLLAEVDGAMLVAFRDCAESYRVSILQSLEHAPCFRAFHPWAVRFFYDDVEVWQAFGYEGASHHLGGYVSRGFDDLTWLPDVPATEETGC